MYNKPFWKQLLIALALFLAGWFTFGSAFAQGKPEKSKVTIAVGGKNLFYYLPLTIAERRGFFKDEGLNAEIVDFPGGARALQAMVGGSADIVGAFESITLHTQEIAVAPGDRFYLLTDGLLEI